MDLTAQKAKMKPDRSGLARILLGSLKKRCQFLFLLILVFAAVAFYPPAVPAQEPTTIYLPIIFVSPPTTGWSQVQQNPQRTGYTSEVLGTNIQRAWAYSFQPEKVFPQVQAIIHAGKVFVGTEMGKMYAIDAKTGQGVWSFDVGAPILSSVAASNNVVYFGAMNGGVYALNATSGDLLWRVQLGWRHGFSTAPVVAENKVLLGGRNGIFYALNPHTGTVLWEYNVGAPILQTAAWNSGKVYFGAMNMHLYAIHTADGTLAWKSSKVPGMAFKDYWPVVYEGKIYVRPMGTGALGVDAIQVTNVATQQALLADYAANPNNYSKSLFVFSEQSGEELPAVIHYQHQTMHGAVSPPCVDRDGYLVVPVPRPTGDYGGGWGRLNINSRIIVDVFGNGTGAGFGNIDENMNLSCAENMVLAIHTQEYNAQYTGAFNLDSRAWIPLVWGHTNYQMISNTQGSGGNPASIADGMIYHISMHNLVARSTQ